jgi:phosphoglycerate kinase
MKKTIFDLKNIAGKIVLVRVDFNVPFANGVISDDNRIIEALPTIKYLVENDAKVVLLSHLGKVDHKDPEKTAKDKIKNNLSFVAVRLKELIKTTVKFSPATRGEELNKLVSELKSGEILLVQNTRYEKGEEKNDPQLVLDWNFADIFVMDAFGSAHRAHASTYGVPELYQKEGKETAIGILVQKEVESLTKCVDEPARPYVAILGGAKVKDKIKVIEVLLDKVDLLIIGGGMAYTFAKAQGYSIGNSLLDEDSIEFAKQCLAKGKGKLLLPIDRVIANDFAAPTDVTTNDLPDIPDGYQGLDIGPKSIALFSKAIEHAKTIFWNGPMGVFENPLFATGTSEICKAITTVKGAFTVIGGGDSAAAAAQLGYKELFSHVSTGGGASLEMIENNGHLPGIDVIEDK